MQLKLPEVCRAGSLVACAVFASFTSASFADTSAPVPVVAEGLENVFRIGDALYSGSSPEGKAGFDSLKNLGIKTILSVDGSKPDVEGAHTAGMRYVHIPVGYDAIPREQALEIAMALHTLPGPFYIHCHHGKHRGPAAAAVALMCSDEACSASKALEVMKSAGTDARYTGLFRSVEEFKRPTAEELAKAPESLPEVAKTDDLVQAMVTIDHHWDNVKAVKAAGWKTPPDHPDVEPAHEALQLLEAYREVARMPDVAQRPEDFRQYLQKAESAADALEKALRETSDETAKAKAFRVAGESCSQCHAKYRDGS